VALCGITFFHQHTLGRQRSLLALVRPPREQMLSVVLSVEEAHQELSCFRKPRYRSGLSTIYACCLRVSEGVHLQVSNSDSSRMLVHVRQGKGARDRYVPLPERPLAILRACWLTQHRPTGLFAATPGSDQPLGTAGSPV
jgi:integrase/recombinase XerD